MFRFETYVAIGILALLAPAATVVAQTTEYFSHEAYLVVACPDTVIGFDGFPSGNDVLMGTEFASQGLTIIQRNGGRMNLVNSSDIAIGSGTGHGTVSIKSPPNALSTSFEESGFDDSLADEYDFVFSGGAWTAGLWIGNVGPGTTVAQFLDASGNIISEETIDVSHVGIIGDPDFADTRIFYGITSDQPISRIRTIEFEGDEDGIVFDDIQFSLLSTLFADGFESGDFACWSD